MTKKQSKYKICPWLFLPLLLLVRLKYKQKQNLCKNPWTPLCQRFWYKLLQKNHSFRYNLWFYPKFYDVQFQRMAEIARDSGKWLAA